MTRCITYVVWHVDPVEIRSDNEIDGFPRESKWERGEDGASSLANAAAAPATVSGEPPRHHVTGSSRLGRRRVAVTREPGDLPSAVVTRETRQAGCSDGCLDAAIPKGDGRQPHSR
jgi:hypothetical protein